MGHEPELLQQCDGIYMPVRQDMISRAKISQWERYISDLDNLQVLEKLQKLDLHNWNICLTAKKIFWRCPGRNWVHISRGLIRE